MHVVVLASILLARTVVRVPASDLPSGTEAPRATDLFRAKRMADEAAGRLRAEPPKRGGWERGGRGWPAPPDPKTKLPARRRVR